MNWPFWCVLGWVLFGVAYWAYWDSNREFWKLASKADQIMDMAEQALKREKKLLDAKTDEGED